ncbi:MAG: extradiol dioxygenase [Polyangiaceae bacterium]|jgi:catechol 2,3-dioxygenase-like lactoylglutathione lyase family enzyme
MIRGIHGLLYSSDPDATRSFFRTKLKLPGSDIGGGWWIFDFKEGDLGVHPVDDAADAGGHDVSFYVDDLRAVVKDLQTRDVTVDEIADRGYGLVTHLTVPGGIRVQLYQPKYTKGASRPKAATTKAAKKVAKKATPAKKAAKAPKKAAKKAKKKARR